MILITRIAILPIYFFAAVSSFCEVDVCVHDVGFSDLSILSGLSILYEPYLLK